MKVPTFDQSGYQKPCHICYNKRIRENPNQICSGRIIAIGQSLNSTIRQPRKPARFSPDFTLGKENNKERSHCSRVRVRPRPATITGIPQNDLRI